MNNQTTLKCSRRGSLRALGALTSALLGATVLTGATGDAIAHERVHPVFPTPSQDVTVSLETEFGSPLETFAHGGSMFVAGATGQRYNIRVTNNSGERVEAVVTVDGRDVVSGELGNFRKQRGYVIAPFGSVLIEGYRQSLSHVAAFRFSDISGSYSARRGTPQHVGVVGVAVFQEKTQRQPRPRPRPIAPRPYYEPYDAAGEAQTKSRGSARPSSPSATEAAPSSDAAISGGFAPPTNNIGTEYGESRFSSVREVEFKRRRSKRPDAILTLYYDTRDGLRSRGVPVDPPPFHHHHFTPDPEPFPISDRRFAPPPPPR
ncbi:MAG: hypothetical protein H6713_19685 [Myxococcales bacterium]|nr:hypothetical protein [Myxococcales bacterium]